MTAHLARNVQFLLYLFIILSYFHHIPSQLPQSTTIL
jgi:hypothetical protein